MRFLFRDTQQRFGVVSLFVKLPSKLIFTSYGLIALKGILLKKAER